MSKLYIFSIRSSHKKENNLLSFKTSKFVAIQHMLYFDFRSNRMCRKEKSFDLFYLVKPGGNIANNSSIHCFSFCKLPKNKL